jgi:hypothetical protein
MSRVAQFAGICLSAVAIAAAATAGTYIAGSPPRAPQPLDDLKDFAGVSLGGPDRLLVSQGADYSVKVEGDPAAIEKLDIYVKDGVLHVGRRWRQGGWPNDDQGATVRVTVPHLHQVALWGSGDIHIDRMTGDTVRAALAGSGDLRIDEISGGEAHFSVAGSGTIFARGAVAASHVSLAGSGAVLADQLNAAWTHVSIAGSGDAHVHAREGARVSIVGSGDAMIRGTTNCRSSRIGSGDVHCSV